MFKKWKEVTQNKRKPPKLKHIRSVIEQFGNDQASVSELEELFRKEASYIYHIFIDTFAKQKREDLDCILFILEKILVYNPELIRKRWQFYSITFVMQKLLHQNNTWRLRQEGVRLFVLWYLILCDDSNVELQTMFASLVPGLIPQSQLPKPQQPPPPPPPPISSIYQHSHSTSTANVLNQSSATSLTSSSTSALTISSQLPIKLCSVDPLVPMTANEQLPNDETSFYLDNLLQFMVTQTTKPHWGASEEVRKNQELSFSFIFNMFKKIYLQQIFPGFDSNLIDPSHKSYLSNHSIQQYVDDQASSIGDDTCQLKGQLLIPSQGGNVIHVNQSSSSSTSPKTKRDLLRIDLKQSNYPSPTSLTTGIQSNTEYEQTMNLSVYQAIVIRWLTRIMRQDMIPGQDELINRGGGGSAERRDFPSRTKEASSSGQDQEFSYGNDSNSNAIFQNMETTSREMEIARRVAGTWPENIAVLHELFRRAFLNYFQPASMKRVVNVYKEWICNGGSTQTTTTSSIQARQSKLGYTSFGDLLQVFVLNSSNAFVTRVHNQAMLDEQVEMCKRIMNIYRYMVMKIYMNTATWEQLLNVMLSITEHLFPVVPPEKKESTIGGRIAPAFFQTFIVSWIRANLYVHISDQMWNEFHRVMKNLIKWRELIEEWSTTMGSLTRVLVKHVYGLSLIDLPLDKPQERRRRPRNLKSFSTAEAATTGASTGSSKNKQEVATSKAGVPSGQHQRHPRSGSIRSAGLSLRDHFGGIRGLVRSNSDGILLKNSKKMYYSSSKPENVDYDLSPVGKSLRKIKSEHLIFNASIDTTSGGRSHSPSQNDVMDGTSLKDPNMILDTEHVMESQNSIKSSDGSGGVISTSSLSKSPGSGGKKQDQKSSQGTCVLLGGSVRGWTPENSVIMWRRMLGLFGNINQIEDPESHLVALRCMAVILCDFIKARENLGISVDNQCTPELPNLIPPYTYHVGWLLEATHLPKQFKESRLTAYKLLCLMSIRRHDIELSQQYYAAFYEALHRGLNSPDPYVHASIIKNCSQLLSLELPGSTFLVQDLFERTRAILLNTPKELTMTSSLRDQAVQILNTILGLHRPIKKLMVLKPEVNNPINLTAPGDIKTKIFDTFLACNLRPVVLDSQTRARTLCSMAIHVFQELSDKYESLEVEKLFDTIMTDLQDTSNSALFRVNCDLLRLFAEHAQSLTQSRPALVSSVIQVVCQLIVRQSTNENNKEAIHCLLICLEDWCMAAGKAYLLKPVDSLSSEEDDAVLSVGLNESLITIVLRSLENVINDEQFIDDLSNKGTRGSMNTSKDSDNQSNSHRSQLGSNSGDMLTGAGGQRDRTMTNASQNNKVEEAAENKNLRAIKLACKVSHHKLVTYLGHFPLRQVGAASMSCCVDESDYLLNSDTSPESNDLKNCNELCLLVIEGNTIVSIIGSSPPLSYAKNSGEYQALRKAPVQPVHLIVRNLCGKYCWDANCIDLEPNFQIQEQDKDSIVIDPDTFQHEDSRSSMKYDSDFNDDGNSSSSMSSRASTNRDYIGDLLNQLNSLLTNHGCISSPGQNMYKKRNTAQSVSNPKLKVAQAEETMIALLTNQRFQELNYCERSDDFDKVVLNFCSNNLKSNNNNNCESVTKLGGEELSTLSFEHCRQLIQQLGYLAWDKRSKIDSLSKNARLLRELRNLDSQPSRETHKIAVIYVASGQEDKNSILTNRSGSRAFEEFVSGLGWEVNLASHLGFKGGLQSNKSTGETSPYYCNSTTEVMFHVSTRIPFTNASDEESLNRKLRHLGNDEIHIVWSEHTRDYRRGIIPTEFSDVIIAIYPMLTFHGYYRIQIYSKQDVPLFGPLFDNSIVHQTSLASLVRATAINAGRAKRFKLPYYQSHFEERNRLIETIVQNHKEKLCFEDFAVQLYQQSAKQEQPSSQQVLSDACCA